MAARPGNQAAVSRFPVTGCRRRVIRCGDVADRGEYPCRTVDLAAAKNHSAHPIVYSHSDVRLVGWPPAITRRWEGVPAGRGRFRFTVTAPAVRSCSTRASVWRMASSAQRHDADFHHRSEGIGSEAPQATKAATSISTTVRRLRPVRDVGRGSAASSIVTASPLAASGVRTTAIPVRSEGAAAMAAAGRP